MQVCLFFHLKHEHSTYRECGRLCSEDEHTCQIAMESGCPITPVCSLGCLSISVIITSCSSYSPAPCGHFYTQILVRYPRLFMVPFDNCNTSTTAPIFLQLRCSTFRWSETVTRKLHMFCHLYTANIFRTSCVYFQLRKSQVILCRRERHGVATYVVRISSLVTLLSKRATVQSWHVTELL
jgi:hypothetical protein